MQNTMLSVDVPPSFFNPHKQYHYDVTKRRESFTKSLTRQQRGNDSSYVLPGGESLLNVTMKSRELTLHRKDRIFPHEKQVFVTRPPH